MRLQTAILSNSMNLQQCLVCDATRCRRTNAVAAHERVVVLLYTVTSPAPLLSSRVMVILFPLTFSTSLSSCFNFQVSLQAPAVETVSTLLTLLSACCNASCCAGPIPKELGNLRSLSRLYLGNRTGLRAIWGRGNKLTGGCFLGNLVRPAP